MAITKTITAVPSNVKTQPAQIRLCENAPCSETVSMLTELLDLAKAGQVTGLVFITMNPRRQIQQGTTGEASKNPVFTLGAVRLLEHAVTQHVMYGN